MDPSPRSRLAVRTVCSAVTTAILLGGCAGYQLGNQTLYRPDIRTVYVPVFESDSWRWFVGERLTEAVIKEIELQTPYKVVHHTGADSVLNGRVVSDMKYVITENRNDVPRDIQFEMLVEYTWRDRQGNPLSGPHQFPLPNQLSEIGQASNFIPEAGQSLATAQVEVLERLAEQIVAKMEAPW